MLVFRIIGMLVLTVAAAILYRMGGSDTFNTKWRDIGIPVVMVPAMFLIGAITGLWTGLSLILCFGLLFGSLTTYWKKKGADAKLWNWILTGLGYSLAMIPYTIATGNWIGFGIRTVIVTAFVAAWSEIIGEVIYEECGRGAIIIATLPLLLI